MNKSRPSVWLIAVIASCVMMNPLNTTMITVAFSRLQEQFQVGFNEISLLIATYYIVCTIGQPAMGKLGDLFGRKKVFIAGLLLITASSLLAPLSPNMTWLMVFRAIQALGISTFSPSGMGIIREHFTTGQTKAIGIISMFMSTASAFGPSIGGMLIHYSDWPSIFYINFPIIAFALVMSIRLIPKDKPARGKLSELDIGGMALFGALVSLFVMFMMSAASGGPVYYLAIVILLAVIFYRFEQRKEKPFIDFKFLKQNRTVSWIYVQFMIANTISYSITFALPSYMQQVSGLDSQQVGLMMLNLSIAALIATPLVARWIEAKGPRTPLIAGSLVAFSASMLLLFLREASPMWALGGILAVFGASHGFHSLGLQTELYEHTDTQNTGIAAGLFQSAKFLGSIICSALLNIVFGVQISTPGLQLLGGICALLGAGLAILSWRLPRRGLSSSPR